MKNFKFIIVAFMAVVLSSTSYAQTHDHSKMDMSANNTASKMEMSATKTDTIKVYGNCDMCKARIEKAAKIDGVSKAEWSKKEKTLTATFDPAKTNTDEIGKKVAAAGHDNEKAKSTDTTYNKLPGCCQYR